MTIVTLNNANDITTGTANGRPVEFSQALWAWCYLDTPGDAAVEKIRGQVVLKNPV
jgi:hypothetical protein